MKIWKVSKVAPNTPHLETEEAGESGMKAILPPLTSVNLAKHQPEATDNRKLTITHHLTISAPQTGYCDSVGYKELLVMSCPKINT